MKTIPNMMWCVAAGLLIAGCGRSDLDGLSDERFDGEPLALIEGTVNDDLGKVQGPLSFAIFWARKLPSQDGLSPPPRTNCGDTPRADVIQNFDNIARMSTQSVKYEPSFPIHYAIPVTALPPKVARLDLTTVGGQGVLSLGFVMAFIDSNNNGVYDFGTLDGATPEPILASSFKDIDFQQVVYLDGQLSPSLATQYGNPTQGFSLYTNGSTIPLASASSQLRLKSTTILDAMYFGCDRFQIRWTDERGAPPSNAEHTQCLFSKEQYWFAFEMGGACVTKVRMGLYCPPNPIPSGWPCN